jgi:hypothetical protein
VAERTDGDETAKRRDQRDYRNMNDARKVRYHRHAAHKGFPAMARRHLALSAPLTSHRLFRAAAVQMHEWCWASRRALCLKCKRVVYLLSVPSSNRATAPQNTSNFSVLALLCPSGSRNNTVLAFLKGMS